MPVSPTPTTLVSIAREVHVAAAPAEVMAGLEASRWRSVLEITPEGAGARVRFAAVAGPEAAALALEQAILDDVCAAKTRLEAADDHPDMVGKSM